MAKTNKINGETGRDGLRRECKRHDHRGIEASSGVGSAVEDAPYHWCSPVALTGVVSRGN